MEERLDPQLEKIRDTTDVAATFLFFIMVGVGFLCILAYCLYLKTDAIRDIAAQYDQHKHVCPECGKEKD